MAATNSTVVVGVFREQSQAQAAIDDLKRAGFGEDRIGYAVRGGETTGRQAMKGSDLAASNPDTEKSVATGAVTGGVIGGLAGAGAALLIPGIGPAVAGGILAATLTGAAVGAAGGAILGALAGMGVSEDEARYYQNEFEAGRTIVTVRADGHQQEAQTLLQRNGAYNTTVGTTIASRPATGTGTANADYTGTQQSGYMGGEEQRRADM